MAAAQTFKFAGEFAGKMHAVTWGAMVGALVAWFFGKAARIGPWHLWTAAACAGGRVTGTATLTRSLGHRSAPRNKTSIERIAQTLMAVTLGPEISCRIKICAKGKGNGGRRFRRPPSGTEAGQNLAHRCRRGGVLDIGPL